jgi:transcriptional regulator with XRE-family HTH domain
MGDIFLFETDFGGLIRRERKEQCLSMKELASRINVSEQALSQWERGTRRIKSEIASALAEALGSSTGDILRKYGHSRWFLAALGWDEEMWAGLSQSSPSCSKVIETPNDALIILLEKMGYYVNERDDGSYSIRFPDDHTLKIKPADLETITDKSVDYINMLFTQLRHDRKKRIKRKK